MDWISQRADWFLLLRQAATHLGGRYEELKRIVRAGTHPVCRRNRLAGQGKGAWMWIMAGEEATVYVAAESRGKGIAQELYGTSRAYAMHDGLASIPTPCQRTNSCIVGRTSYASVLRKPWTN